MLTRAMKDSGIKWIGEIPDSWQIKKVKHEFVRKKGKPTSDDFDILSLARSEIKIRDISTGEGQIAADYSNYNPVEPGDILINPMDLVSGDNSNISEVYGVISPAYVNLQTNADVNPYYYNYYFKLQYWLGSFFAHGKGVSYDNRWTLNEETLKNFPIIYPTIEEQKKIVQFLDEKSSIISVVIKDTQQSIKILEKYKQSLITEVVTKGLDKNVEMKDSGVEWIGEVPEYWNLAKVNRLFMIKKNIANQNGYDVLSVTQNGLKVKDITRNEGQMAADYSKYQIVQPEDFVMNHMDLLTGWIDIAIQEGVTSPDYRAFYAKDKKTVLNEYYLYVFQICYKNRIFYGLGQGVSNLGRWRLQTDKFLNFYLPLPPIIEQRKIVEFLNGKLLQINSMLEQKKQLLTELEEYKKSLIYEYVTGKKEV